MSIASAYIQLETALKKPGCPICTIAKETGRRYLDNLLYEYVNDPLIRSCIEASWGFCQQHTRELMDFSIYSLGIAIINEGLLDNWAKHLTNPANFLSADNKSSFPRLLKRHSQEGPGSKLAAALKPTNSCPACRSEEEITQTILRELNYQVAANDGNITALYDKSPGLCLPHFRRAIALAENLASVKMLVQLQLKKIQALQHELKEFIRKQDYRFIDEPRGQEKDSWRRSLTLLAGYAT
ncbi:hypothetical protein MGLY_32240 [Neomoorella glycerini]|uniref:Uncharacterized protein n=1 Tax=Neomoorella glycerini TaxID=55779 RepID=A0A6I5ZWU8_9FIRM|nr:DUF6062 family protein [Moorella glycerini]QGP93801.1 hypothetical protein MGLY_32240 [Moorella glycerini]